MKKIFEQVERGDGKNVKCKAVCKDFLDFVVEKLK